MKQWKWLDDIQTVEYFKLIKWMLVAVLILTLITFGGTKLTGCYDEKVIRLGSEIEATKEILLNSFYVWFVCINFLIINRHLSKLFSVIRGTITKTYNDSDAYIYERELPKYNAAIAGALFDLKSTFEEDYIAGIIDLISRGYIFEDEKKLRVNKEKSTEELYECEKYILKTCEYGILKKVVNFRFYNELKKDLKNLGFYNEYSKIDEIMDFITYAVNTPNISFFLPMIIFLIIGITYVLLEGYTLFVLCIIFALFVIKIRKSRLTQKGEIEKERISKLKNFLQNETSITEKENNEKALWDRYPAFAIALGVNIKIANSIKMKLNIVE
ncbi:MAG: DUF2207 domain-containing protein [Clostridia bacterium]|nr:DUF2207 domain-containing protein [Clostridia bacterium]